MNIHNNSYFMLIILQSAMSNNSLYRLFNVISSSVVHYNCNHSNSIKLKQLYSYSLTKIFIMNDLNLFSHQINLIRWPIWLQASTSIPVHKCIASCQVVVTKDFLDSTPRCRLSIVTTFMTASNKYWANNIKRHTNEVCHNVRLLDTVCDSAQCFIISTALSQVIWWKKKTTKTWLLLSS